MTLPWSGVDDPAFLALVAEMRGADATILNLETVIHSFRGYAQANSGGTWTASPPMIADELAWAGVNMVAHANNHAFDYGSEGVLETIECVTRAGMLLSGSGKDLQEARAPAFMMAKGRRIALLSMAASFVAYGKASRSRHDHRGRPGLNPLTLTRDTVITVTPGMASALRGFDRLIGRNIERYRARRFRRFGLNWEIGGGIAVQSGMRSVASDRTANLGAIAEAADKADIVVVSIHAHEQSGWLNDFARDAVRAGAGIVLVHGPHEVRGIEFVEGRPVFYCLGDFVYQAAQISTFPAEAYEAVGLDPSAGSADLIRATRTSGPIAALAADPKTYEGCAAVLRYDGSGLPAISLLPVDLQFGADSATLGRPRIAAQPMAERIIADIAEQSRRYGTVVSYDSRTNTGILKPS